jgi:hypothetical protein
MVTNDEFVKAIFGQDYLWCHVTDFVYDPEAIPKDKHLIAWKGDYYSRYNLAEKTNQYFTISTFYCDNQGQARRRKALFRQTHCIVLDDVKEKLSLDQVEKLPSPSWILETSPGSEQWGYILSTPCTDRTQVENLLDGLVANGLAPDGKDPGMKGVTRYVRLPAGVNSKASKLVNGVARQCIMLSWSPFNTVTMEQLAAPFVVNLDAVRREQRLDGASAINDHPLINIPEIIQIKEVRSDGRFDVRCPWVDEHTGGDDSGAAVFTNDDGSIGFKCHHGACQNRTGRHLLQFIDSKIPNWSIDQLKTWQIMRDFQTAAPVDFMGGPVQQQMPIACLTAPPDSVEIIQSLCNELQKMIPGTQESRSFAGNVLKHVDNLPKIDQKHWHNIICDIMRWSKVDFKEIIKDLRSQWYVDRVNTSDFYDSVLFVKELNQFYDFKTRIFFSTEAFQNSFSHEDTEARKIALQDGRVKKVDKLDYAPKETIMFEENGIVYGNMWTDADQPKGEPGNISAWINHFKILGWEQHRDHIEKWMAFTLRHPEKKINHMLLLGSGEGCGKDFLLYPLIKGMGENGYTISGDELTSDFDDYLLGTKYLHINETDLADHRKAIQVSNKLKPIAAAPPTQLTVNQKGVKRMKIRNIVNGTMTTNSNLPLRLYGGPSRRFFAVWSDLNTRDSTGQITQEWEEYWDVHWDWMRKEGWKHVLYYLYNSVSLENFKPFTPPVVTEFLKEIQDSSKSPQQQTVEAFINEKIGLFQSDLMTAKDMSEVIRAEGVFSTQYIFCDIKYITPVMIGRVVSSIPGVYKLKAVHFRSSVKIYAIRNISRYIDLGPTELYQQYELQIRKCKGMGPNLKPVPTTKKENEG